MYFQLLYPTRFNSGSLSQTGIQSTGMAESSQPVSLDTTLPTYVKLSFAAITFVFLCYRWALPKPLPGIPYNKEAARTIFGDMGPMLKHSELQLRNQGLPLLPTHELTISAQRW
jgi:hypothetical protein